MEFEKDLYPAPFDINTTIGKARFFLGDKWIEIGEVEIKQKGNVCEVALPDFGKFLADRVWLDDGTLDWVEWGPRVN